jgi:hypothetical protein
MDRGFTRSAMLYLRIWYSRNANIKRKRPACRAAAAGGCAVRGLGLSCVFTTVLGPSHLFAVLIAFCSNKTPDLFAVAVVAAVISNTTLETIHL